MNVTEIARDCGFIPVDVEERCHVLAAAIGRLRKNDAILLDRGAHERTICQRLAVYLESEINREGTGPGGWHVDCEYNLFGSERSRTAETAGRESHKHIFVQGRSDPAGSEREHSVFPDLIVHRRDESDNEMVVEVKVLGSTRKDEIQFDLRKLAAYVDPAKGLGYRNAFFLVISTTTGGPAHIEIYERVMGSN